MKAWLQITLHLSYAQLSLIVYVPVIVGLAVLALTLPLLPKHRVCVQSIKLASIPAFLMPALYLALFLITSEMKPVNEATN